MPANLPALLTEFEVADYDLYDSDYADVCEHYGIDVLSTTDVGVLRMAASLGKALRRIAKQRSGAEAAMTTPALDLDAVEADHDMRMDAYYYSFGKTGVLSVDKVLSAVACAGKSYHHTEDWTSECEPRQYHSGTTPAEWIQDAADDAATQVRALVARVRALEAGPDDETCDRVARMFGALQGSDTNRAAIRAALTHTTRDS